MLGAMLAWLSMGNEDNPIENVQHKAASGEKRLGCSKWTPVPKDITTQVLSLANNTICLAFLKINRDLFWGMV